VTAVAIVFHSAGGRTRALAEAVARGAETAGAEATLHAVSEVDHAALLAADAIVFGCPTYMGSASAELKAFMDGTSEIWALQSWRDKLAAAFTHSAAPSGDKLGTLTQLAVFAAQHGMIWVGLGLPPTYAVPGAESGDTNRLGSHLGAMAQSAPGAGGVPEGDLTTAELLGQRVAEVARRWTGADTAVTLARAAASARMEAASPREEPASTRVEPASTRVEPASTRTGATQPPATAIASDPDAAPMRHPTASTWQFPPRDRPPLPAPLERTNLRELVARPERFEHHFIVCATLGNAQLEIVTASEPLYFGHVNISDEFALALPSGDPMVDRLPQRTFISDAATGIDLARYKHRTSDLVLHPAGYLHWPGRLQPPYEPFDMPSGMRRCGLSLVLCANQRLPPGPPPELAPPPGRESDVKLYAESGPPLQLAPLESSHGTLARIGTTELVLVARRGRIAPARGGWVVVLAADPESPYAACDLIRVPPGASLDARGISRALVLADPDAAPEPVPPSWRALPPPPFAPFEEASPGALPFRRGTLSIDATRSGAVVVSVGDTAAAVPRYWLARTLYRAALHGLQLNYIETYGGLFIADHAPRSNRPIEIGLRTPSGRAWMAIPRDEALGVLEQLYRAVAPPGYIERLR